MFTDFFPVHKSFLSPTALANRICNEYGFANVICQLLAASMRDIYLVRTDSQRFILVVYRAGVRNVAEIQGEWQFVSYLAEHGMLVAPAIRTRKDELLLAFNLPEGERHGVLTPFMEEITAVAPV
jgi:Ser/Thr protein kinase RdoA (MazF antagonist)